MSTSPIAANPAASMAAQAEASQASRTREQNRKPAVEATRSTHSSGRYAERKATRDDGRGRNLDTSA